MSQGLSALLAHGRRAAQRRNQRFTTAHVLLAMLQQEGDAGRVLSRRGLHESDLLGTLRLADEPDNALEIAIERAGKLAAAIAQDRPATGLHFLLALVRDPRTAAYRCIQATGGSIDDVHAQVLVVLGVAPPPRAVPRRERTVEAPPRRARPRLDIAPTMARVPTPPRPLPMLRAPEPAQPGVAAPIARNTRKRRRPAREAELVPVAAPTPPARPRLSLDPARFPMLCAIGRNLSELAERGELDPVALRDREIEQLLDVLARRRSNNPLLVGRAGVGKTAIVEGLAQRLARESHPRLADRVVVEIAPSALSAGAGVRGALAERIRNLKKEVQESEGRVLLFFDEMHALIAGDDAELANALKPALARGELPCIGATTEDELRRHFERDAALARRFSPVFVEEPSEEAALVVLRCLAPRYEAHHDVCFDEDALEAAVRYSTRYLVEGALPDKAIAVIDFAAARTRRRGSTRVDVEAIADVVAELARVPKARILARESDRLLALEGELERRVIGQRDVVARVADALRKSAAGFRGKRPLGTFLFVGPTGVGKTEMAKTIADVLFPNGAMTRIDMSELSEPHAVAKLYGAPPGYLGHDAGGQLTEAVRRRPYQLVLLDEIEKAHPDVLLSLLPMLDEGRLTDGRGRTVDFTQTVIVMTSNLGVRSSSAAIGFGRLGSSSPPDATIAAVRRALPPELYNRIDEPLCFVALTEADVRTIADRMLDGVARTLRRERDVAVRFDPSVIDTLIAAGGFDPELGARPMRRTIARMIESQLALELLAGKITPGDRVVGRGAHERVTFVGDDSGIEAAE